MKREEEVQIRNRNIRFYEDRETDRRAWEILHSSEVSAFSSQNDFILRAINDYYERHLKTEADPYLETREKEDAFADRIVKQVEEKVLANLPQMMGMYFMQQSMAAGGSSIAFSTVTAEPPEPEKREEEVLESA